MPMTPMALEHLVQALAVQPEVQRLVLFGSRARGDTMARSDIDLAIEAPDATRRQWLELTLLVEEAQTLLPIDLVRLEEASPALQEPEANSLVVDGTIQRFEFVIELYRKALRRLLAAEGIRVRRLLEKLGIR